MILSLIAATKNQISSPEKSTVDRRPVMTPLSFRHFPSGKFDNSRKKFFDGLKSFKKIFGNPEPQSPELIGAPRVPMGSIRAISASRPVQAPRPPQAPMPLQGPKPRPSTFDHPDPAELATSRKNFFRGNRKDNPLEISRVPSLVELLLDRHRTTPYCDIPKSYSSTHYQRLKKCEDAVKSLHFGAMLRENVPFYHHYDVEPRFTRPQTRGLKITRHAKIPGPKVMYLTSATLVVVQDNVLSQWEREITKHCAPPLRVLFLRTKIEVPSVKILATDFDVCRCRILL